MLTQEPIYKHSSISYFKPILLSANKLILLIYGDNSRAAVARRRACEGRPGDHPVDAAPLPIRRSALASAAAPRHPHLRQRRRVPGRGEGCRGGPTAGTGTGRAVGSGGPSRDLSMAGAGRRRGLEDACRAAGGDAAGRQGRGGGAAQPLGEGVAGEVLGAIGLRLVRVWLVAGLGLSWA